MIRADKDARAIINASDSYIALTFANGNGAAIYLPPHAAIPLQFPPTGHEGASHSSILGISSPNDQPFSNVCSVPLLSPGGVHVLGGDKIEKHSNGTLEPTSAIQIVGEGHALVVTDAESSILSAANGVVRLSSGPANATVMFSTHAQPLSYALNDRGLFVSQIAETQLASSVHLFAQGAKLMIENPADLDVKTHAHLSQGVKVMLPELDTFSGSPCPSMPTLRVTPTALCVYTTASLAFVSFLLFLVFLFLYLRTTRNQRRATKIK